MLDLTLLFAVLVLRDLALLFEPAQRLDPVAPHITDGYPGVFGIFGCNTGQIAAPFLVQVGDRNADRLALGLRVEVEPGFTNGLVDRRDDAAVPYLDGDHPRLGNVDAGHLMERYGVAIGGDHDRFEQARRRAPGSSPSEFLAPHFESAVHAAPEILPE